MRYPIFAAILVLPLVGCLSEHEQQGDPPESRPSAAEQLAALGKVAAEAHDAIKVEGVMDGSASFVAEYAPDKQSFVYELNIGDKTERFVVSPDEAIYSATGKSDQKVNRESVMPNGKDWPYASRMAAPFLDAIDGYSATLHSFHIEQIDPPESAQRSDTDQYSWFSLQANRANIHDLLFMEISKASEVKIGVDAKTGLLKCLQSTSSKTGEIAEIWAK